MLAFSKHHDLRETDVRRRDAPEATANLMSELLVGAFRCVSSRGPREKIARVERLIGSEAWTDAALALIDLELPSWQVRRIAYDGGEWHCAVSRQRELPEWRDQSIEAHHADLAIALFGACLQASRQAETAPSASRPSVPQAGLPPEYLCCDNFG